MTFFCKKNNVKAQVAVEYLLLLGAVMALVLIGLKKYLPRINVASEAYYNATVSGLTYGANTPLCGNGNCDTAALEDRDNCCIDCGGCLVDPTNLP